MHVDEVMPGIEKAIRGVWPDAYLSVQHNTNMGGSITIVFAIGSDKSKWSNGIMRNDPGHHLFMIHGTDSFGRGGIVDGEIVDPVQLTRTLGGGIYDKNYSVQKVPFRKKTVSPEKVMTLVPALATYFTRLKQKYEELVAAGTVKVGISASLRALASKIANSYEQAVKAIADDYKDMIVDQPDEEDLREMWDRNLEGQGDFHGYMEDMYPPLKEISEGEYDKVLQKLWEDALEELVKRNKTSSYVPPGVYVSTRIDRPKRDQIFPSLEEAEGTAAELQRGDPEWGYRVKPHSEPGTYVIEVTDEEGSFVSNWTMSASKKKKQRRNSSKRY